MIFRNEEHRTSFKKICNLMENSDHYHQALAYLIALNDELRRHVDSVYDFEERCIRPDCLIKGWQTSTSLRTTRLAFNLYTDHTRWCDSEDKDCVTPAEIFCDREYAPYFWQAVKIRFDIG